MFGLLIASIACYRGLTVKGGAAGVGTKRLPACHRYTTVIGFDNGLTMSFQPTSTDVSTPRTWLKLRDRAMQSRKKSAEGVSPYVRRRSACIMGQSGSGQKHNLRPDLGILRADSGSIFLNSLRSTALTAEIHRCDTYRDGLSYFGALLSSLTVREKWHCPWKSLTDKSATSSTRL